MIILGSTGSIGCSSLKVAKMFGQEVESLVAGSNIALLNRQIEEFKPKKVCIADKHNAHLLQPLGAKVYFGESGILELIEDSKSNLVINALVGFVGLLPSIITQRCGKNLALANKESLVAGGWLLDTSTIIPIDSEHFGLWYLKTKRMIKKLIITASGGAFRDLPLESIPSQTKRTALLHPNWQMGQKITIDSATMVNKLFEVLEAFWLFGCKEIGAFIERSSSIHALIEFLDGSTTAHFALPNMCLPIAYAINPTLAAKSKILESIDLETIAQLKFEPIDSARYPLWRLKDLLLANPQSGIVLNAANEIAVRLFLDDKILFGDIQNLILQALEQFCDTPIAKTYEEILYIDTRVRDFTKNVYRHLK